MYLKKAIRGTIIVLILSLMSAVFGYLLRVILARKLTVPEFGLFYSVLTVFLFISYFVDAGMGQTLSRFIINARTNSKKNNIVHIISNALTLQLIVSIFFVILFNLLANFLSIHYFHSDVRLLIIIFSIWLITLPFVSSYSGIFYGFQKSEMYILVDTMRAVSLLLLSILFLALGYTLIAPAIGYVLTNVLLIPLLLYIINNKFVKVPFFRLAFDIKLMRRIVSFSVMITLINFVWLVITQTDTLMLTYFTDSASVGLYQVAVAISMLLFYLTNSLSVIIFPLASEFSVKRNKDKLVQGLNLVYKYLFIVLMPIMILLLSFPDMIISVLFTAKYLGAISVLKILTVSAIFFSITMINGSVLSAMNRPKDMARSMIIAAIINVILNFIFIPRYGMIGAAISTLTSFVVATVLSSYNLAKHLDMRYPVKTWLILGILGVLFVKLLSILRLNISLPFIPELVLILFIFFISYILILLLLRIIRIREIKEIFDVVFK